MSQRALATLVLSTLFATTALSGVVAATTDPNVSWDLTKPPLDDLLLCAQVYQDHDLGPARIVLPDTCSGAIYLYGPDGTASSSAAAPKCFGGNPTYCVDLAARCQFTSELNGIGGTNRGAYCVDATGPCFVAYEWSTWYDDSGRTCYVGSEAATSSAALPLPCGARVYGTIVAAGCWIGTGTLFWVAAGTNAEGPYCAVTIGLQRMECETGLPDNCITDGTCDPCFSCWSEPAAAPNPAVEFCTAAVRRCTTDDLACVYPRQIPISGVCVMRPENCITDGTCDPCFSCTPSVGVSAPCSVQNYGTGVGAGCPAFFWVAAGDGFAGPYCTVRVGMREMACELGWSAPASPGPFECMYVYRDYNFGVVRVVSRDTCHVDVYVMGENVKDLLS